MENIPLPFWTVLLLALSWTAPGPVKADVRLVVTEGSDVVLPCSVSGKDLTTALFDWRRDGQTEVFLYDNGAHYNNGRRGQDQQVKGRVSHFEDQLKNGNASIKITDTKLSDSGTYTCDFPRLQPIRRSTVELVVELVLKDRTGEKGAAANLCVTTLDQTLSQALLQCKVLGASPKPRVEWQDSYGNKLPAAEPQVTERGGRYDVILNTTVTKTDRYRCVATQETIGHQVHAETFVFISGKLYEDRTNEIILGWTIGPFLGVVATVLVQLLLIFLIHTKRIKVPCYRGSRQPSNGTQLNGHCNCSIRASNTSSSDTAQTSSECKVSQSVSEGV